jgi:hypothetical protein
LANPGVGDATIGVAPDWDETEGWTFNGVDQYLLTPSMVLNNDLSAVVKLSKGTQKYDNYLFGFRYPLTLGERNYFYIRLFSSGLGTIHGDVGINYSTLSIEFKDGVIGVTGDYAYPFGYDSEESSSTDILKIISSTVSIGALKQSDETLSGFLRGSIHAISFYKKTLTAVQMESIQTKMNALSSSDPIPWYIVDGINANDIVCAYQAKGVSSLENSKINLVSPGSYDLVSSIPPTWNTNDGWIYGEDGDQYFDSQVIPKSTWTMICRFDNIDVNQYNELCGISNNDTYEYFFIEPSENGDGGHFYGMQRSVTPNNAVHITEGVMAISERQGYLNGVADFSPVAESSWEYPGEVAVYVGARQNITGGSTAFGGSVHGNIQAFIILRKPITAQQMADLTSKILAL